MMVQKEKLPRKQRDRLRHKQEILNAALKLFAEKGFHEVSMHEIATEAEFAIGTLYNFFDSKEALFEELADRSAEMIVGELEAVLEAPGDEVERLRAFFRRQPQMVAKHADFIRVYVSELGTRGVKCRKDRAEEKVSVALDSKIEGLIAAGVRKKLFRPVDPKVTMMAINSILEMLAFDMAGHVDEAELEDVYGKVEQLFVEGLLLPEGRDHD